MGCAFSSSRVRLRPFAGVRVIHTNGYVQDFDGPVTVADVTAASSSSASARYVLCSSAHLLQPSRAPFRPDDALLPGTVYFLLPHSILQSESSAVDLACLMNRLTALARKGAATSAPSPVDALFTGGGGGGLQLPDRAKPSPPATKQDKCYSTAGAPPKARWKPRLDRIDESVGRASMRSSSTSSARSEA